MSRVRTRSLAAALALLLPAEPLLIGQPRAQACAHQQVVTVANSVALADCTVASVVVPRVAVSYLSVAPANLVPLEALALEDQRTVITGQLLDLGYETDRAEQMADELDADDLAVLLANPRMMQKAGEIDELTKNLIWALVIAGVVVAIVIAADGSISVN